MILIKSTMLLSLKSDMFRLEHKPFSVKGKVSRKLAVISKPQKCLSVSRKN